MKNPKGRVEIYAVLTPAQTIDFFSKELGGGDFLENIGVRRLS